jgi:hypothetical protein
MVVFLSLWIVVLLIVMSNSHTRNGIMASPPSFRIPPEMLSGPTDLIQPITAYLFSMIVILMLKGSHELAHCICGILHSQLL